MSSSYSQFSAFKAIAVAAIRSIAKSPSSVIFTIAFPLIFILVFGFMGADKGVRIKVGVPAADTGTSAGIYGKLKEIPAFTISRFPDAAAAENALAKGDIAVFLRVQKSDALPEHYRAHLYTRKADQESAALLAAVLQYAIITQDTSMAAASSNRIALQQTSIQAKKLSTIDFILPGQLGFSLLAASVFGTAFVFFNLRQGLVLKRFFATPVRRVTILLGEGAARMLFQLCGALFIILVGYGFLNYTLLHGAWTVMNMLAVCAIGLLVFMSFGFVISGIAKSESTIPPLSNILTLPQFLLAGTFFPVDDFPAWLQPVARVLPLTYLNDALRKIAFEGANLWAVKTDILVLLLWGLVGYFAASRLFRWE